MTKTYRNKVITANIPIEWYDIIKILKEEGLYPSKTEIYRVALRNFFIQEIELIQAIKDKRILNKIRNIKNFDNFKISLSIFEKQVNKRLII